MASSVPSEKNPEVGNETSPDTLAYAEPKHAKSHAMNPKEKLSAYFTIAAAAFGLIRYVATSSIYAA